MGTDLDGWVEIKGPRGWVGVIRVGDIAGRNYDMFGCLFGIANYAHFRSLAHDRGLPADASNRVLFALEQLADGLGITPRATWIAWREIATLDWDEAGEYPDSRVHRYLRDERGRWAYADKSIPHQVALVQMMEQSNPPISRRDPHGGTSYTVWPEGAAWAFDDAIYKSETIRRRYAHDEGWDLLFDLMRCLAGRYGDDGVRLVAWFM